MIYLGRWQERSGEVRKTRQVEGGELHLVGSVVDETLLARGLGAAQWAAGEGSWCDANNQHHSTYHHLNCAGNETLRANVSHAHGNASQAEQGAGYDGGEDCHHQRRHHQALVATASTANGKTTSGDEEHRGQYAFLNNWISVERGKILLVWERLREGYENRKDGLCPLRGAGGTPLIR